MAFKLLFICLCLCFTLYFTEVQACDSGYFQCSSQCCCPDGANFCGVIGSVCHWCDQQKGYPNCCKTGSGSDYYCCTSAGHCCPGDNCCSSASASEGFLSQIVAVKAKTQTGKPSHP